MSQFSAIISGTGSAVPERRLTNDDLAKMVDTSDEWIVQRTGIRERRIAGPEDTSASLGTSAARRAIEAAGLEAKDIELIVVATITPEMVFPSTACFIGRDLDIPGVPAFDMTAACSGFIYALVTGANFVRAGQYKHVLVVGAETLSRIVNYKDRNSCILFGDGAGAVVLSRSDDTGEGIKGRGLIFSGLHADGNRYDVMKLMPGSRHPITADLVAQEQQYMQIRGREVYKFAVSKFEELIEQAIRACELSKEQVKFIIPHQVNQRIIDSAMEKLGMPLSQAYVNIDRYGNTSAASIPLALDECWRSGQIQRGDVLIFVAFGGGLTWANAVVRI
jgi:3-oxoacyl-[acyl-carrier-protein] synthase-3